MAGLPLRDELLVEPIDLVTLAPLVVALLLAVDFLLGALQQEIESLLPLLGTAGCRPGKQRCKGNRKKAQHAVSLCNEGEDAVIFTARQVLDRR